MIVVLKKVLITSLQSIQRGLLPKWAKYYGSVTFPGYTVFFLGRTRPGRTRGWIFTVYGTQERSFWGCRKYRNSFGVISPKHSKNGVNRQFQAKLPAEYKNRDILQSMETINVQF